MTQEVDKQGSSQPLIFARMASVMAGCPVVSKDQKNKDQGFMFRGIDDLYSALHKLLSLHGIFTTSHIISNNRYEGKTKTGTAFIDAEITIAWRFYTVDGSYVDTETVGVGRDYADKYASKALAIAHKYALVQVFAIPTHESDNDPDANSIEGAATKVMQQQPQAITQQHGAPAPAMTIHQSNEVSELATYRAIPAKYSYTVQKVHLDKLTQARADELIAWLKSLPMKEQAA